MSTAARKARKRAGIPFVKAQKVGPLTERERAIVVRFGLDVPEREQPAEPHVASGFPVVLVTLGAVLASAIVAAVWLEAVVFP